MLLGHLMRLDERVEESLAADRSPLCVKSLSKARIRGTLHVLRRSVSALTPLKARCTFVLNSLTLIDDLCPM